MLYQLYKNYCNQYIDKIQRNLGPRLPAEWQKRQSMHPLTLVSSSHVHVHVIMILQCHCNMQHEINSHVTKAARIAESARKLQIYLKGFLLREGHEYHTNFPFNFPAYSNLHKQNSTKFCFSSLIILLWLVRQNAPNHRLL